MVMTIEEANKVIAEYMNLPTWSGQYDGVKYTKTIYILNGKKFNGRFDKSLDALVPIWEKLDNMMYIGCNLQDRFYYFQLVTSKGKQFEAKANTIQKAACIATAKAIKSLEE